MHADRSDRSPAHCKKFHYTIDGLPGWALGHCNCQTLFYESDVDLDTKTSSACSIPLSKRKIEKLLHTDELEIKCPSGIWRNTSEVPEKLITKALTKGRFNLFRPIKD